MRKWATAVAIAALAALVPVVVLADRGASDLDRQKFRSKKRASTTSSTAWRNVPGLSGRRGIKVCAPNRSEVSATLSVVTRGAPALFRMVLDGVPENLVDPGVVRFTTPGGRTTSFSFTFAEKVFDFEANSNHSLDVQWRSPSGGRVRLLRGLVNALYEEGNPARCP